MTIHAYLPQDRLRALARGETLPDRAHGSVLFADISGFTALTEGLRESLGARRGAEELTQTLGAVYSALVAQIEKYGGSVIAFAGDAALCWFDDTHGNAAPRATACAFALQEVMRDFATIPLPDGKTIALTLKVTIATGPARRFVVGDPEVRRLDTLAGATVTRTSTAEHVAGKGEVIIDEATAQALGESLTIQEWRTDANRDERFAVLSRNGRQQSIDSGSLTPSLPTSLRPPAASKLRVWLHNAVYEREQFGEGSFLTEFRPCVMLFVRFMGIDYDSASAESELDAFIRQVQTIATRHDGTLMDINIGDKGSYAYINFGALSAHEDDPRRAVKTALELRNSSPLSLQTGVTQGLMRVGAYGGVTRRTYGALGDDVNLAARLMTAASTGEILLSGNVHKMVRSHFTFEPRAPLPMKGKAEPLPVFAVTGERKDRAIRLQEPTYALPMVGRQQELAIINDKLNLTLEGKGQVIGIVAEAGLGKSRLVAEVIRSARKKGFIGYGAACQSDGIHTPYQAWKSVWQAFFEIDPDMTLRKQIRLLEGDLEDQAPARIEAMPLLNVVLDLNIPENDFTKTLEPKIRQSALHALLENCLKASASTEPTLIVIEDLHWIDALSHDLLDGLAKALANYPVCFVLAYRPPQLERLQAPRLEGLPQFTKVELHELSEEEAEGAIRAKLAQLYPARGGAVPAQLVDKLMRRAQGNPFYLEELLNYLRDRGLDPREPSALERIELPDSLHTLILSRIDQLSEQEKTTLRVASVVGRLFRARWLTGYYPDIGTPLQVKAALDELDALDITPLDSPEPELAYLFKHIVTHEVTYESLPFATRAKLHEQLARYLEHVYPDSLPLDTLVVHYTRSENQIKQREYLRKAGEAAQKSFANETALDFYGKLLPLIKDVTEKFEIHMQRATVLELMGQYEKAEADYRAALMCSEQAQNPAMTAGAQFALGKLNRLRGNYEAALTWLEQSSEKRATEGDKVGLAQALIEKGMVFWRKGEYGTAREASNQGLSLAREAGDKASIALALNLLGNIASLQGDNVTARDLYEESLALRRETGDQRGIALSLNNLGNVALVRGDYAAARSLYEESMALQREMGDKAGIALSLNNLGSVAEIQGDHRAAHDLFTESLALRREMGEKRGIALMLANLGNVALALGDFLSVRNLYGESLALCKEMDDKTNMAYALLGLGLGELLENVPEAREHILQSLRLRQERGEQLQQTSSLIGAAGLVMHNRDPQLAAQLLGAVESALKTLNAVMEPDILHFHAQTLITVRAQLTEAGFQSAWETGSKWSLEEAVSIALEL